MAHFTCPSFAVNEVSCQMASHPVILTLAMSSALNSSCTITPDRDAGSYELEMLQQHVYRSVSPQHIVI